MITNAILATVDNDRLQPGAYTITFTRQNEAEISAYVANGDGKQYSVTLTENRAFCSCGDSMFRGKTCKHGVALALFVIRNPQAEIKMEATPPFDLKLAKVRREA